MSYDCRMKIDTGGECPATVCEIGNMTSNVSPMWTKALGGVLLSSLSGKTGADMVALLEPAMRHLTDPANAAEYAAMEPSNGWGSRGGAVRYLARILNACREHPKALFDASA